MKKFKLVALYLILSLTLTLAQNQYLGRDVNEAIDSVDYNNQNLDSLKSEFENLRTKYLKFSKEKIDFNNYLNLGAIYASGKFIFSDFNSVDSALYYLVKAKNIDPLIPETYNQLGFVYSGTVPIYSIEYYKKALKYDTKNQYNFCYEGIVSAYFMIGNPHMALLYSDFLDTNKVEKSVILKEIITISKHRVLTNDYPIEVKIDTDKMILYKNKKFKFTVKYPYLWNERNDIPYDSTRNESTLNLALEEIFDRSNEYTLSAIAVIANDGDISYDEFVTMTVKKFERYGKILKNPIKFLDNSYEFRVVEGKFIDTLVFIKGIKIKYALIYSTTFGAFDLDLDKFKLFLKNFTISG